MGFRWKSPTGNGFRRETHRLLGLYFFKSFSFRLARCGGVVGFYPIADADIHDYTPARCMDVKNRHFSIKSDQRNPFGEAPGNRFVPTRRARPAIRARESR